MNNPATGNIDDSVFFMARALEEARKAFELGEVPVGAVAVIDGTIVAAAHNMVESANDATCHAEMELLRQLAKIKNDWRMEDVTVFVTKEPCAMCAGAMVNSRVKKVVYAMRDPKTGGCGSAMNVAGHAGMLWQVEVESGVMEDECKQLFQSFFRQVRNKPSGKTGL